MFKSSVFLFAATLFFLFNTQAYAKIFTSDNYEDVWNSHVPNASGYGASLLGARREASELCNRQVDSWREGCEQKNGKFYQVMECRESSNSFAHTVYTSYFRGEISCKLGEVTVGWSGGTAVSDANDFYALHVCKKELEELNQLCLKSDGEFSLDEECHISSCTSSTCTAFSAGRCYWGK